MGAKIRVWTRRLIDGSGVLEGSNVLSRCNVVVSRTCSRKIPVY